MIKLTQTQAEIQQYAGAQIFALCARMGGKYTDIHCLTVYVITERGTLRYVDEILPCVANRAQYRRLAEVTREDGYVRGRPTADKVSRAIANGTLRNLSIADAA